MIMLTTILTGACFMASLHAVEALKQLYGTWSQILSRPLYGARPCKYKPHAIYRTIERS